MDTATHTDELIRETRSTTRFQIGDSKYPCVNVEPRTEYDSPCIVLHLTQYTTYQPSVSQLDAAIRLLQKAREILEEKN